MFEMNPPQHSRCEKLLIAESHSTLSAAMLKLSRIVSDNFYDKLQEYGDAEEWNKKDSMESVVVSDDSSDILYVQFILKCLALFVRSSYFASFMSAQDEIENGNNVISVIVGLANRIKDILPKIESTDIVPTMIESSHPYPDNMDVKMLLEPKVEEGSSWRGIKVWFDAESACEANYDYVCFYTSEDLSPGSLVGEAKYTGGRGGSDKNYPTIKSPLIVKGFTKVYVSMKSDG
jgi:hypothetical protein